MDIPPIIRKINELVAKFSNHRDLTHDEIAEARADLSVLLTQVAEIGGVLDTLQKQTVSANVWLEKRKKAAFARAKEETTTTEARVIYKSDPEYLAALWKYETAKNRSMLMRDWVKSGYQVLNSMGSKLSN